MFIPVGIIWLICFKRLNTFGKIIIASIMGRNETEWEELARAVTEAGVDIIECNFSCPNMEYENTGSDVGQDPELVKRYTMATRRGSDLPILAKMTPNITDMRVPARAAIEGGADGIAAINTICLRMFISAEWAELRRGLMPWNSL